MHFDWSSLFQIPWDLPFFLALLNIVFINLILSGDNAVLIAMAVRNLPKEQRMRGIGLGTAVAVVLRVVMTWFVALLLEVPFVKLAGGALILWIAVKLFLEADDGGGAGREAATLWQAMQIILIADVTMSLDNVLAVAGAAEGNLFLLIFGLCMSIPIVVYTSNLLSILMDRYPLIIVVGGAVLGRVGGQMIMTDPYVLGRFAPGAALDYGVQALCTVGVVATGKLWMRWRVAKAEREAEEAETASEGESSRAGRCCPSAKRR